MRKQGFLILDNKVKMDKGKNKYASHYNFWVQLDNEEYYFKTGTLYELYSELFYEEIARILNLPTATYDLAKFGETLGVISKNYNPKKEKEIPLYNILQKYYDEVIAKNQDLFHDEVFIENAFNLEDIWWALEYYYKDRQDKNEIVSNLMKDITNSFMLQIVTFNNDLHYDNILILGEENPVLAPNFDYGRCGLIDFDLVIYDYFFRSIPSTMSRKNNAESMIREFIELSDPQFVNQLNQYAQKIYDIPLNSIIEKIERKTNAPVPEEVKEYLTLKYKDKLGYLLSIIQEYDITERRGK